MLSEPVLKTKTSDPNMKNLSPGRLARPLKKPKYQQSQVYTQKPALDQSVEEKPLDSSLEPSYVQKTRERSHDPVDGTAISIDGAQPIRSYIKSAQ